MCYGEEKARKRDKRRVEMNTKSEDRRNKRERGRLRRETERETESTVKRYM